MTEKNKNFAKISLSHTSTSQKISKNFDLKYEMEKQLLLIFSAKTNFCNMLQLFYWRHDLQQSDTWHADIMHNNTQNYDTRQNDFEQFCTRYKALSIMKLGIMTLGIMKLGKMTLGIMTLA